MEWEAIQMYFEKQGIQKLTEHQIESYDDFIRNKIPSIVTSTQPIIAWYEHNGVSHEFKLSFDNVSFTKPVVQESIGSVHPLFPQEARIRNFTYAAQMFCDAKLVLKCNNTTETRTINGVSFGKIPVMLGSSLCNMRDYPISKKDLGECNYDPHGYFIINGSERTILSQEKVADNKFMVFYNKKTSTKYTYYAEIKSLHESFTMPPKKFEIRLSSKFNGLGFPLTACIPKFREDIPLFVLFRALGVETDEQIVDIVSPLEKYKELLIASFKECAELNIYTQNDAIEYLVNHIQYPTNIENKHAHVASLLETEFLPHVRFGVGDDSPEITISARKLILTSLGINKIFETSSGDLPIDDRDAYLNKRVVTTGALLTHLFRQIFQKVCKDIRGKFVNEINGFNWSSGEKPIEIVNVNSIYKILKISTLESKLRQSLATGNFNVQGLNYTGGNNQSNATKIGVSQVLNRISYSATISHIRRIQTPIEKSGKLLAPRKIHGTSWGYVCPVETPEGHSVGIVKTISLMTSITQYVPSITIASVLKNIAGIDMISDLTNNNYRDTRIMLNGTIIAFTSSPKRVSDVLRNLKRTFQINPQTGISWDIYKNIINIESDSGRFTRPLFRIHDSKIVENPKNPTTWNDFVATNVEYIDPCESETIRIATSPKNITRFHTHCEIHPVSILGHMASSIPFPDHNQSPRNTYQSAMGKQAVGLFSRNYAKRIDKNGYILCSPMRPLVETRMMRILKAQDMPSGNNIMVAIMCYSGYNQEDSVILNRGAVKRGLFRSLYYTIYKDEERRNSSIGKDEHFTLPIRENTAGYKTSSYHAVDTSGAPILNSHLRENDVIIGKVTSLKSETSKYKFRDASITHKNSETCRVDGVWRDTNSDGYSFIKARVVSERIPEIGDKFSSRHGQKGTCGIILNEEDMPFTASGLRPDLIMNPHAVPSRMTIAQLLETMYGKVCCETGSIGDGTPFDHQRIGTVQEQLLNLGMHHCGNEIMYNGQTGEIIESEIFMGPVFYQRLKHMVIDKKHSRAKGPIVSLTRQPCEGRSNDGGLRIGEMERDCMLSHGVSAFTKERMIDVSDPFPTGFCKKCGNICISNVQNKLYQCGVCGVKSEVEMKTIPYALKLWNQELKAMHIDARIIFR